MPEHTEEERKKKGIGIPKIRGVETPIIRDITSRAVPKSRIGPTVGKENLRQIVVPRKKADAGGIIDALARIGQFGIGSQPGTGERAADALLEKTAVERFTPIELTGPEGSTFQTEAAREGFAGAFTNIRPAGKLRTERLEDISGGTFSRVPPTEIGVTTGARTTTGPGIPSARKEEITDPASGEFAGVGAGVRRVGIDIGRAPKPVKVEGKTARRIKAALIKTQNEQEKLKIQRIGVESEVSGRKATQAFRQLELENAVRLEIGPRPTRAGFKGTEEEFREEAASWDRAFATRTGTAGVQASTPGRTVKFK